jgi:cystathionine gamma-synthase
MEKAVLMCTDICIRGVIGMYKIDTQLAQIGNRSDTVTGTVNPPVYFSTAYRHEGLGQSTEFDYSRTGNPTRQLLENTISDLEYRDQGFACSSGMAAIMTVLSLFQSGDEWLVSEDLYGGTYRILEQGYKKWGLKCQYVNTCCPEEIERKITPQTKAIFLETPTNPLMKKTDISAVSEIAKKHGIMLIVDNTFYTPLLQQPITLGADIVIHSATKYSFVSNVKIPVFAVSLGSVESILSYPTKMSHAAMPKEEREKRGIKNSLLRLSVGLENPNDLIKDFSQAFQHVQDRQFIYHGGERQ